MNAGHTLVKFRDETTRDLVLEAGVVHFDRKPVLLRPWSTDLDTLRVVNSVPVWMRLPNLGLQYWGLKSLSALVSTIGKPMMMDKVTKEKSMVKFARVLVDVEITDRLPHSISFINERGQLMEQAIEFEWLPTQCSCCKGLGHTASSCKNSQEVVWRPKQQVSASGKGDIRGATVLSESKIESKPVVGNQKDVGKEDKGDELNLKGGSKESMITTTKDTNEASCSTTEKEKTWTTPKKVGGLRKKSSTEQTLRANTFSVLQEKTDMVSNKELHKHHISNGGVFLETKLHSNKIEEMMHDVFVGWNWYSSKAIEGRILLVWNPDLVHVAVVQELDQLVTCEVQIKGVSQTTVLSFVYGRNSMEERKNLWVQLQVPQYNSRPWLVAGDFNAVFEYDDRIGGRQISAMEVEDSRQWKANSLLIDLRSSGSSFTWSNKQKEGLRIFSKLDRIFVNEVWIDTFPDSEGRINWDTLSDHCFCIIKIVHFQTSGVRPFRYFNMWDKHQDFRSSVLSNWSKLVGGTGLQKIIQKLKRLKPTLIQFKKVQIGDVEEDEAAAEFARMSKLYESFLRQKSKNNWLRFGDENTAYFHASLKQRRMRNRITSFTNDEGQVVENPTEDSVLTLDHQLDLIHPFTKKDVKRALFSIPTTKSPGPDGYGSGFFKSLWKDIGDEITEAIMLFFESGVIPTTLNGTILSLIPKVVSPSKATDYHPIACCNTLYKCISKMICFRLAKVLPMIIHQDQGAFIQNRQLAHNILILQDILHGYSRKNISPRCVIKIDLSKAYDSVDWKFMEDILNVFCFPRKFVQWIMNCLTGTSYTLLFNGRLQGSFEGKKGLRQGDLISPLLFVLAMEYLTRILSQASHHKEFRYHPLCKNLHLVNLCFADDLILFCKGNVKSVKILFDGFLKFCRCSGLEANLSKSQVFFGGVAAEVCLPKVMGGLGFKEGSLWNKVLLAKYLWALSSKQDVLWRKVCYLRETFSVKELESAAPHGKLILNLLYNNMLQKEQVGFAKVVWSSFSVPRHRFILWQAVLGHLLTRDNLARCPIEVNSVACPVCDRGEESHSHLFFDCIFSHRIWELINSWLGAEIWPKQRNNWKLWLDGKPKTVMQRIYIACLAASVYHIWCNRNMCYFSQVSYTPHSLVKIIKRSIKIRLQGRLSKKDLSKNCKLYEFVQML
ncbi:uncharacterized protein LOC133814674 [Humulus lupulus]|uniref:uncharacterized protein LOC133814674 n=1 Tax=Humulus lupulus TaxID=3486 RepID=UPI002B410135|nr:uncharacterized protein LOC133814674 [Humulus lupulus]